MIPINIQIYLLCILHCFLWLFVVFSGFISVSLIKINLLFLLPLIMIAQAIPTHVFMKEKIKLILKNKDKVNVNENYIITRFNMQDITHFAEVYKIDVDDIIFAFKVIKYYEHKLIVPKVIDALQLIFDNSFRNPFDAQGLIIIGYIMNVYLLYFGNKSNVI